MTKNSATFKTVSLRRINDDRGSLCVVEGLNDIPFNISRVYYLYSLDKSAPRGFHAHRELRQFAVCLSGSVDILMDDGKCKEVISLATPDKGLMIEPMQWHEMHNFSDDCILMVFASDIYREVDYIRSYSEFKELLAK